MKKTLAVKKKGLHVKREDKIAVLGKKGSALKAVVKPIVKLEEKKNEANRKKNFQLLHDACVRALTLRAELKEAEAEWRDLADKLEVDSFHAESKKNELANFDITKKKGKESKKLRRDWLIKNGVSMKVIEKSTEKKIGKPYYELRLSKGKQEEEETED